MDSPLLPASEVGRLLSLYLGPEAGHLASRLDSFLPSLAASLENRGLEPDFDDVPSCAEFRFLQELRRSMPEERSQLACSR